MLALGSQKNIPVRPPANARNHTLGGTDSNVEAAHKNAPTTAMNGPHAAQGAPRTSVSTPGAPCDRGTDPKQCITRTRELGQPVARESAERHISGDLPLALRNGRCNHLRNMQTIDVGDIRLIGLIDGEFIAGPEYFGANVSFVGHETLLAADGKMHLPIGCFLLHGGPLGESTVLVDAGLGEMSGDTYRGGYLMDEIANAGMGPDQIDQVIITHLHIDHCGWLMDAEAQPRFPNAEIWMGTADWERFVEREADLMLGHTREGLRRLAEAAKVHTVDGDKIVAPGVNVLAAPGHTPGHMAVVVSSGDARALLLGDAVTCPVQLDETDWGSMGDVDPRLARRSRQRMWDELESSGSLGVGAHFPELRFGRVLPGSGHRYWA